MPLETHERLTTSTLILGFLFGILLFLGSSSASVAQAILPQHDRVDCYAREYSRTHLAEHPEQTVTAMSLGLLKVGDYDDSHAFVVAVKVRGQNRRRVTSGTCYNTGSPARARCRIDCDGASFKLRPSSRAGSIRLELGHINFGDECGPDDPDFFELQPGTDDKVFRLDPAARTTCVDLFDLADSQSLN